MALTRPKIWDIDTSIEYFKDPITVLHQSATQANVDVGFLFNRANGLVSNVALYWSESTQSFVTAFTSNTGATDSNIAVTSYANLTVGSMLMLSGAGIYINGTLGSAGQVLGSTGTGLAWISNSGFNGGTITNALTDPAGVQNTPIGNATPSTGAFTTVTTTGNLIYGTVPVLNGTSTTTNIGIAPTSIDTFATAAYRGAKYLISTSDITNAQYQMAEIILTQDGVTVSMSVYGVSYTGTTSRMTFTSNIVSGNATLWATGVSTNNTVKLARTLIPV
jgi:hypothetical protein